MAPVRMLDDDRDATYALPDARHESFAQFLSDGMTQIAAYEAAGFVAHGSNANLLAKRPAINLRVKYLIKKKAADAGMTAAGRIVVDLENVTSEALKMSPEWFLYNLMKIVENDGVAGDDGEMVGGSKDSDRLKALQLGADWLGYFKDPKTGKMKAKESPDDKAISEDSPRRVALGKESALSRYSGIFDGTGNPDEKYPKDGGEGTDHAAGSGEDEEHVKE